jgi:uncharacterized phage protein gp47/JayE
MALPAVGEENYPTPDDVLNVILSSMQIDGARRGITIDVSPGSDHYVRAKAFAKRVSVAIANGQIARDDYSPLTATGDSLRAICEVYGVAERAASAAAGYVIVRVSSGTASIPAGFQATAPNGEKYQTTTAAVVSNGGTVQVQAVNGGEATNLDAGAKLTWDSASIGNLNQVCTVDSGGLEGGTEADTDDTLRRRLLNKLARPGVGGNASQIEQWAEEASSAVQAAYAYAAVRGPGSYDVAITSSGHTRALSSAIVSQVAAYIAGKMPGHADLNCTSVSLQLVDVVLAATLALPTSAGGAGGGWRDATPWPNASSGNVQITSYNSGTGVATTDATAANGLAVGTRIGVWDATTNQTAPVMREFTVASATLNGGFYDITVQGGFGFNPTAAYISTGAVNLVAYSETVLEKMRELGPGEKTSSVDILPRGRRQPTPEDGAETDLNSKLLTAIQNEYSEIRSLEYAARYASGTVVTRTSPSVATTTSSAPRILVLANLAIRKA